MQAFEYLIALVSILVGLALADLAASLHRLLRARKRVVWHWHALAAAAVLVLIVLDIWWGMRHLERAEVTMTIGLFLPMLVSLLVFFLLAAAALPDEVPSAGLDLRAFYIENGRYFWSLFALFIVLASTHVVAISLSRIADRTGGLAGLASALFPNLVVALIAVSLALTRRSWWHSAALTLLLAALLFSYVTRPLT
jgi:hypothetical protein